ncbi:MAG TPA: hypothetical protein VGQ59_14965 [Cyclobacteriaceae bacterium]|jgi:hypothetical protein|nr:hypothetical protein [Cyclobacteriaceae bacterium]
MNTPEKEITKSDHPTGIVGFLMSSNFVLITLFAITIPLMVHTANLLLRVSLIQNEYYAYFFAFAFDLAIFTHAINGHRAAATGLAFIVFILNLCFFNLDTFYAHWSPEWVKFGVTFVLSGSGAYILHSYVMMFHANQQYTDELATTTEAYNKRGIEVRELIQELNQRKKEMDEMKRNHVDELKKITSDNNRSLTPVVELVPEAISAESTEKKTTSKFYCDLCKRKSMSQQSFDTMKTYCNETGCDKPHKNTEENQKAFANA